MEKIASQTAAGDRNELVPSHPSVGNCSLVVLHYVNYRMTVVAQETRCPHE